MFVTKPIYASFLRCTPGLSATAIQFLIYQETRIGVTRRIRLGLTTHLWAPLLPESGFNPTRITATITTCTPSPTAGTCVRPDGQLLTALPSCWLNPMRRCATSCAANQMGIGLKTKLGLNRVCCPALLHNLIPTRTTIERWQCMAWRSQVKVFRIRLPFTPETAEVLRLDCLHQTQGTLTSQTITV